MSRSGDTEARIRGWLAAGDEHAPDDLVEAVLAEFPSIRQRRRWEVPLRARWVFRSLRWTVGMALLVMILVLLLATALLVAARPPSWVRLSGTDVFGNGSVTDVVLVPDGLLAVGTTSQGGHDMAAAWGSTDGLRWRQTSSGTALADTSMGRIARQGTTVVAVGFDCPPGASSYCGGARILRTVDEHSWQAAATDFRSCCGSEGVSYVAVTAGGPGFVAVGTRETEYGTLVGASIATSVDGSTWKILHSTSPAFVGASMAGVAAGSSGLVTVGAAQDGTPEVWRSADGRTWSRIESSSALASGTLTDVASDGRTFVAVGSYNDHPAAWTSSDGVTWQLHLDVESPAGTAMTRVVWAGREFIALGRSASGSGVAWSSTGDGFWTLLATGQIFSNAELQAVAQVGSRLVLFGRNAFGQVIIATNAP